MEEKVGYQGRKLRETRLRAMIGTQKELAVLTGIAPNIISDLERGRRRMSPSWAMRIAEALGDDDWQKLLEEDEV